MAINFSASFAACLAAGLKVPRQIMYCISQDTGAPYVLYKDPPDGANGTVAQWNPETYPNQTQTQQAQNPQHVQQNPPNNDQNQMAQNAQRASESQIATTQAQTQATHSEHPNQVI
jgi:hypothetical protein